MEVGQALEKSPGYNKALVVSVVAFVELSERKSWCQYVRGDSKVESTRRIDWKGRAADEDLPSAA